jgi:hypothetical protein
MNEGYINTSHYLNGTSFHNVEVKDGSIGVNLQSRYIGIGAYVDSFYRNKDNSLLPAEEVGTICLGDIIFSINSTSLITLNLKEIYEVIRHSKYPLNLIFLRLSEYKFNLIELTIDPRKVSFIDNFLNNKEHIDDFDFFISNIKFDTLRIIFLTLVCILHLLIIFVKVR